MVTSRISAGVSSTNGGENASSIFWVDEAEGEEEEEEQEEQIEEINARFWEKGGER